MGHPCRREAIGNFLNLPEEKEFKECVILISNEKLSARKRELHLALKSIIDAASAEFDLGYYDYLLGVIGEAEEVLNKEYMPNE